MAGYTKDFLISVYLSRYYSLPEKNFESLEKLVESFYDEVGRDKFRYWCALDAEKIQKYKLEYGD